MRTPSVRIILTISVLFILPSAKAEPTAVPGLRSGDGVAGLKQWLALPHHTRPEIAQQSFARVNLSKQDVQWCEELLWQDLMTRLRTERAAEWQAKQITLGERTMRFEYHTFGEAPAGGRSLFISMHGGGGGPARMNDRQWENQKRLYEPREGIYVAPRAPSNDWDLWHQAHIDDFFDRLIANTVALEDVNPNRVYLMGYSAGGDGVYQLAPRMADRFAAASMMAGHPNETSPLGLRNLPFAIFMGGKDAAYDRNKVAARWKEQLAKLQQQDPQGYPHEVTIYPEMGHWMQRKDQVALEWMAGFERNPYPKKIVWKQDDVTHERFYWIGVPKQQQIERTEVIVSRDGQAITIEQADESIKTLIIYLRDDMLDLDKPVTIRWRDQTVFAGIAMRRMATLYQTLQQRMDKHLMFPVRIEVSLTR